MNAAPHSVIGIDIGSTYTKGARFELGAPGGPRVLRRAATPTTPHLAEGFRRVLAELTAPAAECPSPAPPCGIPVRFSSSAKGGLSIVAVGLVPALTVKVARLAACSAGGKVVRACAYALTPDTVAGLAELRPDIVLLTGGTDGGNRERVLHNARALADAALAATIVYAGNAELVHDVRAILGGANLRIAANVMPAIDRLNLEPARAAIRAVFLETIVQGKGLADVVRAVGAPPRPTPLAIYELCEALADRRPGWRDFLAVDMGGATTDVYAHTAAFAGGEGVVLHGVCEPRLTRTVEGDLGLRVSAPALVEALRDDLRRTAPDADGLERYARRVAAAPAHTPQSPEEEACERLLTRLGAREAVRRHAGLLRAVWTPTGRVCVQHGKDLRRVRTVVGTGGALARARDPGLWDGMAAGPEGEDIRLLPGPFDYRVDADHLWPLLGNLAAEYPEAAAALAEGCLTNGRSTTTNPIGRNR